MDRRVCALVAWATAALSLAIGVAAPRDPFALDPAAERWVEQTLRTLTPDEKIGQLIVPSAESTFVSTDTDAFDALSRLPRGDHRGGGPNFRGGSPSPAGPPLPPHPPPGP